MAYDISYITPIYIYMGDLVTYRLLCVFKKMIR